LVALVILLAGCLFAYYSTRDSAKPAAPPKNAAAAEQSLVDTRLLQTAHRLAPLAATPDEQEQALEAARLADHELDLAFNAALRDAEAAAAAPATGFATKCARQDVRPDLPSWSTVIVHETATAPWQATDKAT
jgi:hypothetical protein